MPLRRAAASPVPWFLGFALWAAYLFTLSANPGSVTGGAPQIPHIDKILHFGYFLGGGGLLAMAMLLWERATLRPVPKILVPLAILWLIAGIDEWWQSFSPGRSGNDPIDWLADALGSLAGVLLAKGLHPRFLKIFSPSPHSAKKCVQ